MSLPYIFITVIYLLLSVSGLVLFKLGSEKGLEVALNSGNIQLDINLFCILGLSFYVISFLLYMFLISRLNLSYIAPIANGLSYILTFIASIYIFKEHISINNYIGALLILIGVILINIKK